MLAVTQTLGWGVLSLLPVIGRDLAGDLSMALPSIFLGTSVMYVVTALAAPMLGQALIRAGARSVMMAGFATGAGGLTVLALATGPFGFFAGWLFLGLFSAASLTTSAYVYLNAVAGKRAKSMIGSLMLVTGLASSIFWPLTAFLSAQIGWRATVAIYAMSLVIVAVPLLQFGLPQAAAGTDASARAQADHQARAPGGAFGFIVAAIICNGFVTVGFEAVIIETLRAMGIGAAEAVAFGSVIGMLKVGGRLLDIAGGGRWDGLTTGVIAAIVMPLGIVLLLAGGGAYWSIGLFALLFGLGSGAFAVARATMPLVFFDTSSYALAMARIALPLNLIYAAAPPLLSALLTHGGSSAVLICALAFSLVALAFLAVLDRRRRLRNDEAM
ncbi:MFS transporter [Phreatobacter aquaticus]|uniref:MFS transporter n=1 Tax=Phreatobacter aquaticus TaxID=2570229 RepID=UPI00208E3459|nr:MFS transporter [Phreatobacter aquaticus]